MITHCQNCILCSVTMKCCLFLAPNDQLSVSWESPKHSLSLHSPLFSQKFCLNILLLCPTSKCWYWQLLFILNKFYRVQEKRVIAEICQCPWEWSPSSHLIPSSPPPSVPSASPPPEMDTFLCLVLFPLFHIWNRFAINVRASEREGDGGLR